MGLEGCGDGRAVADREGDRGSLGDVGKMCALLVVQANGNGDCSLDGALAVAVDVVPDLDLDRGELPAFACRVYAQGRRRAGDKPAENKPEW